MTHCSVSCAGNITLFLTLPLTVHLFLLVFLEGCARTLKQMETKIHTGLKNHPRACFHAVKEKEKEEGKSRACPEVMWNCQKQQQCRPLRGIKEVTKLTSCNIYSRWRHIPTRVILMCHTTNAMGKATDLSWINPCAYVCCFELYNA